MEFIDTTVVIANGLDLCARCPTVWRVSSECSHSLYFATLALGCIIISEFISLNNVRCFYLHYFLSLHDLFLLTSLLFPSPVNSSFLNTVNNASVLPNVVGN